MNIEFLYFEDCPSHEDALQRLQDEMASAAVTADVRVIRVETEEAAQQHRFTGSPTIRINGTDIVPPPADVPYNLACRVYQWADGRYSPLPSPQMIRDALHQAQQQEA